METTRQKLELLFDEMQMVLNSMLVDSKPSYDWRVWSETVQELRSHLKGQLERCNGRFSGDVDSVGEFLAKDEISGSLQQIKKRLEL